MGHDSRRDCRRIWHPLRWPVDIDAVMREQGVCPLPVKIVDISLTGCRLSTGYYTRPGAWAKLSIGDFAPFKGTIIWSDQRHAAIQFDQPLHLAVLQHLITLGKPQKMAS